MIEAEKFLREIMVIEDTEGIKINEIKDGSKPKTYDIELESDSIAMNMRNNDAKINWIQLLPSGRLLIRTNRYDYWIMRKE